MSGPPVKRVRFAESHVEVEVANDAYHAAETPDQNRRNRRIIDSDEEDQEVGDPTGEGGRLAEDSIEGQEDATISNDNGIAITPFNLREEMQEGYFDSAGCYIFKKEDKDVRDNWLDNVDWESVKPQKPAGGGEGGESDESGDELGAAELARLCATARTHLAPSETVAGAIKRLGGGANRALTASQRLRLKKSGGAATAADDAAAAANRQRMLELSELAGRLVSAGHMTVYQMDARQLARLGGVPDDEASAPASSGAAASGAAASMDMFASDDEGEAHAGKNKDQRPGSANKESTAAAAASGCVSWRYRVTDSPADEVLGPFSSRQMLDWSQSDQGWPGGHRLVFVRKLGAPDSAPFYSSARIDFDLYV